jgi:hydroxymethylglutaryl-CoA reductase
MNKVSGFSKLDKQSKIDWLSQQFNDEVADKILSLRHFWNSDQKTQKSFDEFSENTLSNFYFPFGIAPNFLINNKVYTLPMVIEESSVVAAASKAARFWLERGGFHFEVLDTQKVGHVHFFFNGEVNELWNLFEKDRSEIINACDIHAVNMNKRGGGINSIALIDKTDELENYFQVEMKFETCDAMGANFINTILEEAANYIKANWNDAEVNMAILSNYTPECIVKVWCECSIDEIGGMEYAKKFKKAVDIARVDRSRAVTHNKGIMNGVDALVLATGNDFRATEACVHAFASRDGKYRSLSKVSLDNDIFKFEMELPLALGTVGGLTKLHPLASLSLDILGRPSASELMGIIATLGLAQNFAAINSLTTTGIQKGHMKMHLLNILNQLEASRSEIEAAKSYFLERTISYTSVRNFLHSMRLIQ